MSDPTVDSEPATAKSSSREGSVGTATVADKWTTRDQLVLVAITAVAAAVRLISIEQWSWSETEAQTYRALTQPLHGGDAAFTSSAQATYPVGYLALRWLLEGGWLPGFTEGWLRLPFAFAGSLAAPLVALFARPRVGRVAAQLAALLLALHPAHVEISQTADPLVMASTVAILAGVLTRERVTMWSWLLVVLAGSLHPFGWCAAIAMVLVARADTSTSGVLARLAKLPWWAVVGLGAPAALLGMELLDVGRLPLVILAISSIWLCRSSACAVGGAAVVPLVVGGVAWLIGLPATSSAVAISVPILVVLASVACVQVRERLLAAMRAGWVGRSIALGPGIIVVGELATALFLYLAVFQGGRPPWRELQRGILNLGRDGGELQVAAISGVDVLRSYLRPGHWREPGHDPHPGRIVQPLDLANLQASTVEPPALLALRSSEWQQLLRDGAPSELSSRYEVVQLWACARATGDDSLYLLRRMPR